MTAPITLIDKEVVVGFDQFDEETIEIAWI